MPTMISRSGNARQEFLIEEAKQGHYIANPALPSL